MYTNYLLSLYALFLIATEVQVFAEPLQSRQGAVQTNTVLVDSLDKFCMTVPKDPYTSVGDSKRPNGSTTYCSKAAKTDVSQGEFPSNFWTHREFRAGTGPKGGKVVQRASLGGAEGFLLNETVTGCINPAAMDRLNASDPGGQYDSKPGSDGSSTVCIGYNHYVELMEPAGPRACIRCCDDENDCSMNKGTLGCPNVVPGNYFSCP